MMPRQKRQQLKQRQDGRYVCYYQEKAFYGSTSDEALKKRKQYITEMEKGLAMAGPKTVSEYVEEWLPMYKADVSTKCYNDYAKQFETLCSVIGDVPLSKVNVDDTMKVFAKYKDRSASLIKRSRMLFIAFFDTAVDNGYCQSNPFRSLRSKPPKGTKGTHRNITDEERALIINTPHRFRLAAMVMLYAGLRRGEVMALSDRDIDLENQVLHINKAIRFDSNQGIISTPKTDAGNRDVPIFPPLQKALEGHSGLIVHGEQNPSSYCSDTAFRRGWDSWLTALSKAAGKRIDIRPHDLRHSFCTMLRDAGVDLKQAMIWMGHSDEKMILQIYDHATDRRRDESMKKVLSLLENGQNDGQSEG